MNNFLVVRPLDPQSTCTPTTFIYGKVELRSRSADTQLEIAAFKESAENAHLDFDKYSFSSRIATIVEAENVNIAINIADDRFSEALDLKSIELPISKLSPSPIGLTKNLETGEISAIANQGFKHSMTFLSHIGSIQQFDSINLILSLDTDLSKRYLRSLHWSRNSKHETNQQLKILFNWFSVEALLKESETDHIGGSIRWFLGFPNGRGRLNLSFRTINALESHPRYAHWDKELIDITDKLRTFRNDSVHHGFRLLDFSKETLKLYNQVMLYGTARCQAAVQVAIINNLETVPQFKEYIPIIFEENKNLIKDTHSNIIYSFDNPLDI